MLYRDNVLVNSLLLLLPAIVCITTFFLVDVSASPNATENTTSGNDTFLSHPTLSFPREFTNQSIRFEELNKNNISNSEVRLNESDSLQNESTTNGLNKYTLEIRPYG